MNILVLNPWILEESLRKYEQEVLPHNIEIAGVQSLQHGAHHNDPKTALNSTIEAIVDAKNKGYGAVVMACFSDIGVNEASIADSQKQPVPAEKRIALMLREMKKYIRLFEKRNFNQLVLSAKSSDPLRTIEINRRIAETFDYPIHLGLTHAGLPEDARIPSAISLGTLLAEGIGDTIRVSVAGNPVEEAKIAKQILTALGLCERSSPELIVCPTCGRAEVDVIKLAKRIEKAIRKINKPLRIAVMGCIVNGPGEAADADIALCGGKNKAYIYHKGKRISIVPESQAVSALISQLDKLWKFY